MSGSTNYVGGMVFEVKDVQAEVDFWTKALGMRVTSDVETGETRGTLAYGQTSLNADDGGKAAVEIRQAPEGAMGSVGNVLSYVAVTVPFGLRACLRFTRAAASWCTDSASSTCGRLVAFRCGGRWRRDETRWRRSL